MGIMCYLTRISKSDPVRKAIRVFIFALLATFIPGLLGWLNDLTAWANSHGQQPLPDAGSLAYLGVSAINAAFIAALTLVWNVVEDKTGHGLLRTVDKPISDPVPVAPPEEPPATEGTNFNN